VCEKKGGSQGGAAKTPTVDDSFAKLLLEKASGRATRALT
jgi:hypothetical protein